VARSKSVWKLNWKARVADLNHREGKREMRLLIQGFMVGVGFSLGVGVVVGWTLTLIHWFQPVQRALALGM
jgi:hypothetical protein